jgi:hypothetical protein
MTDIATVLSQSSIASAREAAQALQAGGALSPLRENDVLGLIDIYRARRDHLKSLPGPHAAKMAASIEELLENLQGASSVQTTVLEGPGERTYYIFLTGAGSTVLGCIDGVDKRKVSDDRWKELWQVPSNTSLERTREG